MDSQITITQCELLSLSPEVRNQAREVTSNQRIVRTETPPASVEQNLLDIFAHIEVADDEDDHARHEASRLATMPVVLSPMMKTLTPALSNDVLILIRDITLYVQFHIIRNPAYNVLLG